MIPGTHTAETCALNAGLIYANQEYEKQSKIKTEGITDEEGLYLEVYNGYFADNMDFFNTNTPMYTGIATQFNSISSMTNQTVNTSGMYSIRLTGHIIFDVQGVWKFFMTSDDSSRAWIGDTALDATITPTMKGDNSGDHGMRMASFSYNVTSSNIGKEIPIKMVMGNRVGGSGFIFQYLHPNYGSTYIQNSSYKMVTYPYNKVTYLRVHRKGGIPTYNRVYYALIGDPSTNTLSCGIYGDPHIETINQGFPTSTISYADYDYLHKNINNGQEVAAWRLIVPETSYLLSSTNSVYIADSYRTNTKLNMSISPGNLVLKNDTYGEIPISFNNNNIYIEANLNFHNTNYQLTDDEARQYINNYPDLKEKFGTNLSGAKAHYQSTGLNEGRVYTNKFTASIDSNGCFFVKDTAGQGNVIWSLHQIPGTSDSFSKTQTGTQRLSKSTFAKIKKDAVTNIKWKNLKTSLSAPDTLFTGLDMGQKLTVNGANGGIKCLIDTTGKYKIQMSEDGNLVFVITTNIEPRTFTEKDQTYTFTTYEDNMIYLNNVSAPSVMGKTFALEDVSGGKELRQVDTTSPFFSYVNDPMTDVDRYTKYDTMYPTGINISNDPQISTEDCANKCTPKSDCKFYYSYNYGGKDYCKTSGENDIITFATKSDSALNSSTLYVKNPDLLYSKTTADRYNPENKMQNVTAGSNKDYTPNLYSISSMSYSLNGEDQIIDSSKYNYYSSWQNTLIQKIPEGSASSGLIGETTLFTQNVDELKQSMMMDNKDQPLKLEDIKISGEKPPPNYASGDGGGGGGGGGNSDNNGVSRQVGSQGFTNMEGFDNEADNGDDKNANGNNTASSIYTDFTIADFINNGVNITKYIEDGFIISSQSVPIGAVNIGSVGTIGTMSSLDMKSHAKSYSNPKLIDLIGQDLFFYNFLGETANKIIAVGSYNTNRSDKYGKADIVAGDLETNGTSVSHLLLSNPSQPYKIYTQNEVRPQCNYLSFDNFTPKIDVEGDHASGITISFWVNITSNLSGTRILDFGNGMWSNNIIIAVENDYLYFTVVNNGYTYTQRTIGKGINYGDWHHICWTLSTDGIWMIYINGAVKDYCYTATHVDEKAISPNNVSGNGATFPNPKITLKNCYIGKSNWWWDPYFDGRLSEFRIYNALISKEEIGYIYNTTIKNYNTNDILTVINRGISLLCFFNLKSIWHIGDQENLYTLSRNADGSSGDIKWGSIQIYKRGYPGVPGKPGYPEIPQIDYRPGVKGRPKIEYQPYRYYSWWGRDGKFHWYSTGPVRYQPAIADIPKVDFRAKVPAVPSVRPIDPIPEKLEKATSYIVEDTDCKYKYCYKLDGEHFASITPMTLPSNGVSFCVWVRFVPRANSNWARIFDFGNGENNDNIVMAVYNDSIAIHVQNGSMSGGWRDDKGKGSFQQFRPDWYGVLKKSIENQPKITPIADDKWHHLVWTLSPPDSKGNSQWIVYLDNEKQALLPSTGLYPITNTLKKCFIGKSNWVQDPYLKGSISDFRIYSRVLSDREVSTLYKMNTETEGFKNIEGFSLLGKNVTGTSYSEGFDTSATLPPTIPSFQYYDIKNAGSDTNENIARTYKKAGYTLTLAPGTKTDFTLHDLQNNIYSVGGITKDYNRLLSDISGNYRDLSSNIHMLMDLSDQLIGSKYAFRQGDIGNNINDIINPSNNRSTQLVLKDDVQELILRENTIYTIGVITCATLLISALFISSRK